MKSGETAGQGNGTSLCADRTQAKRAGPKLEAGPKASAERSEGTMEARQGRDAAGGSMRSTTARPAMFLGRGRSVQVKNRTRSACVISFVSTMADTERAMTNDMEGIWLPPDRISSNLSDGFTN